MVAQLGMRGVISDATYILVSSNRLVYVARGEFVQFLVVAKDDDSHVDRAEDGQLMRLLEQTAFPLEKGTNTNSVSTQHLNEVGRVFDLHGTIPVILDGLDLDLSATHSDLAAAAGSGSYAHSSAGK